MELFIQSLLCITILLQASLSHNITALFRSLCRWPLLFVTSFYCWHFLQHFMFLFVLFSFEKKKWTSISIQVNKFGSIFLKCWSLLDYTLFFLNFFCWLNNILKIWIKWCRRWHKGHSQILINYRLFQDRCLHTPTRAHTRYGKLPWSDLKNWLRLEKVVVNTCYKIKYITPEYIYL